MLFINFMQICKGFQYLNITDKSELDGMSMIYLFNMKFFLIFYT